MHQLIDKKNRILIYLILLFILSTTSNKTLESQKNYSHVIDKINITGLSSSKNTQLLNELNNIFYRNIFILDKKEVIKIMSKHNIIEEYNVKKIYPSELTIEVKPTKFIAKISGNNQLVVGSNGKLIQDDATKETLPYIFGKFSSQTFLKFKKIIEYSNFNFIDFKSLSFYPSNRWDILTTSDILIKLPENDLLKKLDLAYKIIKDKQFEGNKIIDLRIKDQIIIK